MAVADAEKMTIQAEAAASHNRVALNRMLIDQLPEIVDNAARGLSGANLTVLNGAEGLTLLASGLVSQGVASSKRCAAGLSTMPTRTPRIRRSHSPDARKLMPDNPARPFRSAMGIESPANGVSTSTTACKRLPDIG
ncbi:hypothetical protein [Mycobacterium lacus]|uniref:hypothetical protein n=1 Tax=Mycobacterium lacus TaxID=169765 RepID=UPI001E323CF7|nr:hypothetical protein [Mycobacterium lacus]